MVPSLLNLPHKALLATVCCGCAPGCYYVSMGWYGAPLQVPGERGYKGGGRWKKTVRLGILRKQHEGGQLVRVTGDYRQLRQLLYIFI